MDEDTASAVINSDAPEDEPLDGLSALHGTDDGATVEGGRPEAAQPPPVMMMQDEKPLMEASNSMDFDDIAPDVESPAAEETDSADHPAVSTAEVKQESKPGELSTEDRETAARLSYVPKCTHPQCKAHNLVLQEYCPGTHNPPAYVRGWVCDSCKYSSLSDAGSALSMFRWVCYKFGTDLCRGCAQQEALDRYRKIGVKGFRVSGGSGDKPKKPRKLTGYNMFVSETYPKLKKQNLKLSKDMQWSFRNMSRMWSELSDDAKQAYQDRADVESFKRESRRAIATPQGASAARSVASGLPAKLHPSPILGALAFFHNKQGSKEGAGDLRNTDKLWSTLTDEEKEPFVEMYAADKLRYEIELAAKEAEFLAGEQGLNAYAKLSTSSPSMIGHFAKNFNIFDSYIPSSTVEEKPVREAARNKRYRYDENDDLNEYHGRPVQKRARMKYTIDAEDDHGPEGRKKRTISRWSPEEIDIYLYLLRKYKKRDFNLIFDVFGGRKSMMSIKSWFTNYRKKRNLDKVMAEGLRPQDHINLKEWRAGYLGDENNEDFNDEEYATEPINDDGLPGPVGSQVLDYEGKPIAPSTNPRHYCSFCCRLEVADKLVSCVECANSGHQQCLQFSDQLWTYCKKDPNWTCIECKACSICSSKENDDQLIFCDTCDQGYHIYCLNPPLKEMPDSAEPWQCHECKGGKTEPSFTPRKPAATNSQPSNSVSQDPLDWPGSGEGAPGDFNDDDDELGYASGPEENEETDGTHVSIPGFYFDTVRKKYIPRPKKKKRDVALPPPPPAPSSGPVASTTLPPVGGDTDVN